MSLLAYQLTKKGQPIDIADRDAKTISGTMQEVFSNAITVTAIVKNVSGVSMFDDTNTEQDVTHKLRIDYVAGIDTEKWVLFKSRRLRILYVENCCEQDDVLILHCTERGTSTNEANDA